jgi:thiamine pyrophosphate-dependent acetolactate synthase large subunit-like protein
VGKRFARLAAALCIFAGAMGADAGGAGATTITLQAGHAVRVATSQQIIGRDGDELFVGMLGYHGHVAPGSLWFRENDSVLVVGRNPSGPLGSAPAPAELLFGAQPTPLTFGTLRISGS